MEGSFWAVTRKLGPETLTAATGLPLRIQNRHGDAAQTLLQLFIVDGIAAAAGLLDLSAQSLGRGDGAVREALEADAAQQIVASAPRAERPASPCPPRCNGPGCWRRCG